MTATVEKKLSPDERRDMLARGHRARKYIRDHPGLPVSDRYLALLFVVCPQAANR